MGTGAMLFVPFLIPRNARTSLDPKSSCGAKEGRHSQEVVIGSLARKCLASVHFGLLLLHCSPGGLQPPLVVERQFFGAIVFQFPLHPQTYEQEELDRARHRCC